MRISGVGLDFSKGHVISYSVPHNGSSFGFVGPLKVQTHVWGPPGGRHVSLTDASGAEASQETAGQAG